MALVIKLMAVLPIIFFLSTLEGSTIWCGVASWPVWIESSRSSSGATLLFSSAGEEGGRVLSTWAASSLLTVWLASTWPPVGGSTCLDGFGFTGVLVGGLSFSNKSWVPLVASSIMSCSMSCFWLLLVVFFCQL